MPDFDWIVRGGQVIEGTGAPRFPADVGVQGDRITAVGDLSRAQAAHEIDAGDRIVAPGFIDVHNHSEGWLLKLGHLTFKTRQGFTTEVLMSDGISYAPLTPGTAPHWLHYLYPLNGLTADDYRGWTSIDSYLCQFEQDDSRIAQNVAVQIPYANIRATFVGWGSAALNPQQSRQIQTAIRTGMEAGAAGLSTGLDYVAQCFATTDELVAAAEAVAPFDGLYVTHIRYKLGTVAALAEAAGIARRAGVRLHVSHLKTEQSENVDALLAAIDAAARDVDFTFDCYPFAWSSSMLNALLPYDIWRDGPLAVREKLASREVRRHVAENLANPRNAPERIHLAWLSGEASRQYVGATLAEYANAIGTSPADAVCDLLDEENLAVLIVFRRGEDGVIEPFLTHPRFMLGSDGIYAENGCIHPRVGGSAPRLLGPLVRERKLFTLEDAVRRMTSFPAERFGLVDRGVIKPGAFADVVVFDPETVTDRATYDSPYEPPIGIDHVLVNGVSVVCDEEPIQMPRAQLPGKVLRL